MAFGITKYELAKLLLMIATLVAVVVSTVWFNVRMGELALNKAELAQMLADDTAARARFNQDMIAYTRGEQSSLKDRVESVERKVTGPLPKVVVVMTTPKPGKPTPTPTPVPTPKHPRGGLGALFTGDGDD